MDPRSERRFYQRSLRSTGLPVEVEIVVRMRCAAALRRAVHRDDPRQQWFALLVKTATPSGPGQSKTRSLRVLHDYRRPQTRGDCLPGGFNAQRPCHFVACKYHLAVECTHDNKRIKHNFPGVAVENMRNTCWLDVADRGGVTASEVARVLNVTVQAVRQTEAGAYARPDVKRWARKLVENKAG